MSRAIAVIPKNRREEIRVELCEYRGYDLINLRVWVDLHDSSGDGIPTKAGIAFRVTLIPDLIAALQKAEAEARRLGLLDEPDDKTPR